MARRFDIRDPKVLARVTQHREDLKTRTLFDVETLHYFHADARWTCLDISIDAPTESELDAKVVPALLTFPPDEVLPCAPAELWTRMVNADSLPNRLLRQAPPRGIYVIGRAEEKTNA